MDALYHQLYHYRQLAVRFPCKVRREREYLLRRDPFADHDVGVRVLYRKQNKRIEEMSPALMHELSRGVPALPAKGMYSKEMHSMLLCVVSRRQVPVLRKIMKQVDPDSFAVMSKVSQVLGLGFYSDDFNS